MCETGSLTYASIFASLCISWIRKRERKKKDRKVELPFTYSPTTLGVSLSGSIVINKGVKSGTFFLASEKKNCMSLLHSIH